MKKKLLNSMRVLLVAAGLCVGVSAWGAEMTTMTGRLGATNNTDGLMANHSKHVKLAAGESYVYSIVNNQAGSGNIWNNWAIEFRGSDWGNEYATFRADGEGWGSVFTSIVRDVNAYQRVTDWMSKYNGANVTITVSRSADGTGVTIVHTSDVKDDSNNDYGSTFSFACDADEAITFYLGYEAAWIDILSVNYNNTSLSYASSESAYVDATSEDTKATIYNGASLNNLYIRNTQFRESGTTANGTVKFNANGKLSLYKFDLTSIKNKLSTDGGTITGVTFSVYGTSSETTAVSNVRALGYNPTWSSSTLTQANLTNTGDNGTLPGTVSGTQSFQPLNDVTGRSIAQAGTTLTENALTYVNSAIAANADYVTIAVIANNNRDALMNTVATLTFTYSAAVLYEATFTENNSLSPTITVYSNNERTVEVAKNELAANTTYYYTATLAGYERYNGSFDVETSNPEVSFTMIPLPRYTFTVNAVNSDGGATIQALYTDADSYDGKPHRVYFPAYLTGASNVVTYSKENSTYYADYVSASGEATKTQNYTAYTGNAWFFEGEDVEENTEYTTSTFAPRSSSGSTGVLSAKTVTSLNAGSYKISARVIGKDNNKCYLYKTSTSGEQIMEIITNTTGKIGVAHITLDATTAIIANGGYCTSTDNGYGFDYILIEKVTSVPATVTSAGWATLYTPYALDFSDVTGLETYTAAVSESTVTLTKVNNVPANTGVVLKGSANTYSIPVIASSTTDKGHLLGSATEATAYDAYSGYTLYMLKMVNEKAQFVPMTSGSLAAGKAYLKIASGASSTARSLNVVFADEATGIQTVQGEGVAADGYYNLSGQRVSQPTKGLYIVNGKKIIVK